MTHDDTNDDIEMGESREEKLEKERKKQQKILEKLRKKTNFAYQRAVYKNKRNNDRKIKSKDLLRSDSKD